ncbi:hypothetical protein [Lactococcus lactis]
MVKEIFTSEKAQKYLRKHFLEDEQKYILKRIEKQTKYGYDSLTLYLLPEVRVMDKRAFYYIKNNESWMKELGYHIEMIMENEMVISWGNDEGDLK